MITPQPGAAETLPVIYPAQGSATLISRSWNLFRKHLKTGVLVMLAPTAVYFIFLLLLGVIASQGFLIATTQQRLTLVLLLAVGAVALLGLFFLLYGYCCCALMRYFYGAITMPAPWPIRECWDLVWRRRWTVAALLCLAAAAMIAFAVVDTLIFYLGVLLSVMTLAALGGVAGIMQSPMMVVIAVVAFLIFGFVVLAVLIGLFSTEWFMVIFPLLSVATAERERSLGAHLAEGLGLLGHNFARMLLFALALFLFSAIVSMALHAPVYAWAMYEQGRLGMTSQVALPLHVSAVINLWTGLINIILMPFYISTLTLFWYDCKVRAEGLDLRLWFRNLAGRRGADPARYFAVPPPEAPPA